jgi:predicted AAA+ superfamily ATPase
MKNVSESLAGRAAILDLYSFSLNEIDGENKGLFVPKIEELKNKNIKVKYDSNDIFEKIFNGGMPSIISENMNIIIIVFV